MLKTLRLLAVLFTAWFSLEAYGAAAIVTNLSGTLYVQKTDGTTKILSQKSEVDVGDILSTEKDSYARLKFTDGGEVIISPKSRLKVDDYRFEENTPEKDNFVFSLLKGGLRTITGLVGKRGNRDAYRLNTPVATIGIRGTHFRLLMCQNDCEKLINGLHINVISGTINVRNQGGDRDFTSGQFGYVKDQDTAPELIPDDPGFPPFESTFDGIGGESGEDTSGPGCYVK
jgi:hypothetical protein